MLVNSVSALGFAAVREAEGGLLEGLREALRCSVDAGRLAARPPEPLAALLGAQGTAPHRRPISPRPVQAPSAR